MKSKVKNIITKTILIVIAVVFSFLYAHTDVKHSIYDTRYDTADWITTQTMDTHVIIQEFSVDEEYISGVQIQLTLVDKLAQGKLIVELMDNNFNVINSQTIDYSKIQSGRFNKIKFDSKVKINPNEKYSFKLTQKSKTSGQGIMYSATPKYKSQGYIDNGEKTDNTLVLRTLSHRFNTETFIVCLGFIMFIFVFMSILFKLFKA